MEPQLAQRVENVQTENAFVTFKNGLAIQAEIDRDPTSHPFDRVIFLCLGEPDFRTPRHICRAAIRAILAGVHHYGPAAGQALLQEAIVRRTHDTLGLTYDPDCVVVTPGAKPLILYTLLACVDPDMEVVYPNSGFPIYPSAIDLIGARPVPIQLREENGFQLDPDELESLITDRTRLIILNTPHNPTGSVLSRDVLREVARIATKYGIWVLSDEVYDRIIYDGLEHVSIAQMPGMQDQTVIMNGHSKAYAMTGWRVGYGVMPKRLAAKMTRLQTNVTSCTSVIMQAGALAAIMGEQECVQTMVSEFDRRRQIIVGAINDIPDIWCRRPGGAFYAWANVSEITDDCEAFADDVLRKKGVAIGAGTHFGQEGYVRFSFANSIPNIKEGIHRFRTYLGR